MIKRYLIGVTAAAMFTAGAAAAQTYGDDDTQQTGTEATETQQTQPGSAETDQTEPATTTQSADQDPATHAAGAETTLTGCVYREEDVPGRSPNVAERAGILEDYILAVADSGAEAGSVGTTGAEGATGTSGAAAGSFFKLEHEDDDNLRSMVGKRVEVTGRIDAERDDTRGVGTTGEPAADESLGPDSIELPEFEVSSIREVSGDCPAQPEARQ